jgi:anti-sigma factor RsiW
MTDTHEHLQPEELSAYADRDLDPGRETTVGQHLAGCDDCRAALREIEDLKQGLRALADAAPARELWPRIARAHAKATRPSFLEWLRTRWAIPAAALAGAAAALVAVWVSSGSVPTELQGPGGPDAALQAVARAEAAYRKAIVSLEGALAKGPPRLGGKAGEAVRRGLADVDLAIEWCRAALQRDPNDLQAQEAMLAAYQRKVDFLEDVVMGDI